MKTKIEPKRTQDGAVDTRCRTRVRGLGTLVKLLRTPKTVDQIMAATQASRRSVYLWIADLQTRGIPVARLGPRAQGSYCIVRAPTAK